MIETPQVTETATQHTAVIRFTIPRSEMPNVMGPGIAELMAAITAQGIVPAGPLFTHHFKMDPGIFDFELGVPVATPVAATGRMMPSQLLATKVARTVYRGAYEGLPGAWGEFMAWLVAGGHKPGSDLWECYLAGPESSSDPADWQTELNRPLTAFGFEPAGSQPP